MWDSSLFLIAAAKRRERGISLQQISNATKIGVRLLQAIEECDFAKLPGGIYNTSYIRQYAKAVDVDEVELLTLYRSFATEAANPAVPPKPGVRTFRPVLQG